MAIEKTEERLPAVLLADELGVAVPPAPTFNGYANSIRR